MRRAPRVTFVIMAGGKGERLWPVVRQRVPKVCLSPQGKRSLLALTVDRLRQAWPDAEWLIVTTQEQAGAVRACLPGALRRRLLIEPHGKNTAACLTLAALTVAARDPQRVLVASPADHWVDNLAAFRRTLRAAIDAAVTYRAIATIGLRPTHPHAGLGYLCAGTRLPSWQGVRRFWLARFVEKPSHAVARRLARRPHTYWNMGVFLGTAETVVECLTEWLPAHVKHLLPIVSASDSRRLSQAALSPAGRRAYRALPNVSFDLGVMKHLVHSIIVEGRFSWTDLGSWDAGARLDGRSARTVSVDSRNITVYGPPTHLVATVGVRDLLVVHTPTATLICHPQKVQAIRQVVNRLSHDAALAPYR